MSSKILSHAPVVQVPPALPAEEAAHTVGSSRTRSAPPFRAIRVRVHLSVTAGRPCWTQLPLITAATAASRPSCSRRADT